MIWHFNTLFSGNSIGRYYNECCRIVPPGGWICLWDADVLVFTTFTNYNDYLERAIRQHPGVKLFSCLTNRVTNHNQRYWPILDANPDIIVHRERAETLMREIPAMTRTVEGKLAGFMLLFNRDTWEALGGFDEHGIAMVDTDFTTRCAELYGASVVLCGMYVFHYFRLAEDCSPRHIYDAERREQ
jgi:GT2 family glycosyltransferase